MIKMRSMFERARSFESDISKWDVSSVRKMASMFKGATSFHGDPSKWDVSKVTKMDGMFADAKSFKQKLCGAAWVHSKASKTTIFEGSVGSIPGAACTSVPTPATTLVTRQHISRRPIPERELITRTPISTPVSKSFITSTIADTMTCPKCGMFAKSGRMSCCAPGGAWFKNCGGAGNINVDHRWFEGVEACKRKFKANVDRSLLSDCIRVSP